MGHMISVVLEEPAFGVLKQCAHKLGKDPAEVSAEWIRAALNRVVQDPMFELAGAFESDLPDWVERHDEYLGQGLLKEMQGGGER